jgi:hypothetical protein
MEGENAGDMALAHRLFELDFPPKFHLFGHIHEGYGKSMRVYKQNDWAGSTVRHANVSALDRMYKPRENPAIEFEV